MTMTAEQLAQLRVLTERAISDGWGYDRDEFYEVLTPEMTLALLNDLGAKDITLSARDYHFDQQADRIEYLEKRIAELEAISSAAEKLVRCKGRYHSEQNYRALAALFGVTTPDLPPLESEARAVTVKIPAYVDGNTLGYGEVNHMIDLCVDAFERACHVAGINLTVEG